MSEPVGARDELDTVLLHLHRSTLASTVRAGGQASSPVTATQVRVLTLLASAGADGLPVSAIADALALSAPSASRLCQRMVRDELATRSAGPGHYILISLAAPGRRTLREVNRARVRPLRQVIDALPERQRNKMISELAELARLANQQDDAW